ncbi:type IV pili methyl-accepting chemotaxis transducer N-terminal domain-containing protein [Aureispira sp. CCB-QB1]|uniref:type IV pili methyl-accepting chemotaxis transducer N-terminal domain-containing protein n=1 Tax=Aureispira sp. CCB-QB1 TaxID=1313421 RepID=UPI000697389F|nr:type IV pili methyl-accepting chemotaxis transducer N-terminal domain-containing protein [Aureispira sp. CCB-QB1]
MYRQTLLWFALLTGLTYPSYTISPPTLVNEKDKNLTIREALNIAMRQQTLSQRIAKVYFALNNNLYEPKFYQERDQAIETFDSQLEKLKNYAPTDKIKQAIKNVRELWLEYKKVASWSINEKGATKLLTQCDHMLRASTHLVASYEEYAQELGELYRNSELSDIIKLIKETGNQRMLTQRIMLFYLAAKQDIDKDACIKKLTATSKEYDLVVAKIANAEINSPKIQVEIKEIQKYWSGLSNYIQFFDKDPAYVNSMLLLSNELTQKADKIAAMYQDLGKKLSISKTLNVIAYQNMLTQRIAKSYVAMTYKYAIPKHKRELVASIDLFEEQINSLQRSAPTEDTKEAIRVVNLMWKNYRKLALDWQDMNDISVGKLLEKSHVIMASCDQVAKAIEDYAQTIPEYKAFYEQNDHEKGAQNNIAQQVYTVGVQRVYSQRIVVYFIMNALGKDSQLSQERLYQCFQKYEEGYELLNNSSINTQAIKQVLHSSQKEWEIIVKASKNNPQEAILTILDHSDTLFSKLDKLNELYEKLMDKLIVQ